MIKDFLASDSGTAATLLTLLGGACAALWRWHTRGKRQQEVSDLVSLRELYKRDHAEVREQLAAVEARAEEDRRRFERQLEEERQRFQFRIDKLEHLVATDLKRIVDWIDSGAEPPPPEISQELRGLIGVLTFDWREGPS